MQEKAVDVKQHKHFVQLVLSGTLVLSCTLYSGTCTQLGRGFIPEIKVIPSYKEESQTNLLKALFSLLCINRNLQECI